MDTFAGMCFLNTVKATSPFADAILACLICSLWCSSLMHHVQKCSQLLEKTLY